MFTPIAPYRPKPDEGPKPSNYMIDAIGIPGSEVSDEVRSSLIACFRDKGVVPLFPTHTLASTKH